jgi:hypothetical protein
MLLELDAAYMDGRVDLVGGAGGMMVMVSIRRLCLDGGDDDQED